LPEKVKIYQKKLKEASISIEELNRIQVEFAPFSEMNNKERQDHFKDKMAEKKRLKISF
jgi:hypothetical protein